MNSFRDALINQLLMKLNFNDDKYRSCIIFDCNLLSMVTESQLNNINLYLDPNGEISISCRKNNAKHNFVLHDLLDGIYPFEDHCFHLNSHSDIEAAINSVIEIMKINITVFSKIPMSLKLNTNKKYQNCKMLILSRDSNPDFVLANKYFEYFPADCNIDSLFYYRNFRYRKIYKVAKMLKIETENLKNQYESMMNDLKSSNINVLNKVQKQIVIYNRKKQELDFHLKTIDFIMNNEKFIFKDKNIESLIRDFVSGKNDQYIEQKPPIYNKSLKTIHVKEPIFIIFITEGFTLREVSLTAKLMDKYKCKIILGGNRLLDNI